MYCALVVPEGSVKGRTVLEHLMLNPIDGVSYEVILNKSTRSKIADLCTIYSIPHIYVDDLSLKNHAEIAARYDLCIICGWGWIIDNEFIASSKAIVNCHSSYLPDYKGASVYFHQWANCEKQGGASIHLLASTIDAGDILYRDRFSISSFDTPGKILFKASRLTAELVYRLITHIARKGSLPSATVQGQGRYFLKVSSRILFAHRLVNILLRMIGTKQRWLTPFR